MMKIFRKGVFTLLMILSAFFGMAQVGVVAPSDACGGQGEETTISITGVSLDSVRGMQFTLNYDPAQIDIVGLTEGSSLSGIVNASNPFPGAIIFSWVISDVEGQSLPDNTVLLDVVVNAIGPIASTEPLEFSLLEVETASSFPGTAPSIATDGAFTVECASIGNPLVLSLDAADAECDDTAYAVDVTVAGFDTVNSLQFTLNWDPSIIDYASVGNFASLDGLDMSDFGEYAASGQLTFSWFDGVGTLPDGAVLFTVYFDVQGNVNDVSGLSFGNTPTPIEAGVETAPNVSAPIPVVTNDDAFTVIDAEAPVVTCPEDVVITNILGFPTAVVNDIAPVSVTDNCGPFVVSWDMSGAATGSGTDDASGVTVNIGTSVVTYYAMDDYGNVGQCSFNVTLNDTLTINVGNSVAECGETNYTVDFNADYFTNLQGLQFTVVWDPSVLLLNEVAADNMPATTGFGILGTDTLTFSWFDNALTGQSFPNGYTMFTLSFTVVGTPGDMAPIRFINQPTPIEASADGSVPLIPVPIRLYDGNVLVEDNLAPVVSNPPADLTFDCVAAVPAAGELTAEDQCDGTLTEQAVEVVAEGGCANDVVITRTWTFTDAEGNSTVVEQTITVLDDVAPVAPAAPADAQYACASEVPAAEDLTAVDNCDGSITVSASEALTEGSCANDFVLVRTWTFTDICGNSSSVSQTITVLDDEVPVAPTAPADAQYACASEVPAAEDLTAVDNCDGNITVSASEVLTEGSCANDFILVRTWTFTDICGNSSSVSQTITVLDDEAPVAPAAPADAQYACAAEVPAAEELTAVDNCDGAITVPAVEVVTPGACVNDFVLVRTWTFTDICGNSSTVSQTITVLDDEAPIAPAAPADAQYACATEVPAAEELTAVDNCDGAITASAVEVVTPGACVNDFVLVRTWTFTDICGNSSSVSQTITVLDDEAPVAPAAPADAQYACATEVPAAQDLTATDNCDGAITASAVEVVTPGACVNDFLLVRTWTFTDVCGNSSSVSQTITVLDDEAPVAPPAPANELYSCASEVPAASDMTAVDNCDGAITVSATEVVTPGDCANHFEIVRTWTFTDICGNTSSISHTITVNDDQAPVTPVAPADAQYSCASEVPAAVDLTAVDNCDGDITVSAVETITPGSCLNDYILLRTWTFTDICGNSSSVSQTITVSDDLAPDAPAAPADAQYSCAADVPAAEDLTAVDNCDGAITVSASEVVTAGACANDFVLVRTWTFTDICGNSSSVSQTITVSDDLAPDAPAAPADAQYSCAAEVPAAEDLTAVDNCDGAITVSASEVVTAGACANDFVLVRTWTFTDICGNSSSVSQTITVSDDLAPDAPTAPADAQYSCAAEVPVAEDLTAVDNCDGSITASAEEVVTAGSCANDFILVRTWTFTDNCGNSSSVSQTITVSDDEAPLAPAAPADATYSCAAEVPSAVSLTAEDNCNGAITVMPTETITDNGCVNQFTLVRTWTFTDECGNSSTAVQTIEVNDSENPVLAGVPADVTVECDNVPGAASVTATDNCGDVDVDFQETILAGNCPGNYSINRTWTATDACGNVSSQTQIITVEDTTDPVLGFSLPADQTVQCAVDVPAAFLPDASQLSDNCTASADISVDFNEEIVSGSCPNNFTVNRSWEISDACGNSVSFTQTITVNDNTAPVVGCQDVTVELDANGNGIATAEDVNTTVVENCGAYTLSLSKTDFECMDIGDNTVTLTATDACGNAGSCTATVTVEDNLAPTLFCPEDQTINLDPGACDAVLSYNVTATDNCEFMLTTTFLSTTFNNNNNFAGNMFDLENIGSDPITITHFDVNLTATPGFVATFDVYFTPGTYVGNNASPANWTLLGSNAVVAQGQGNPSELLVGGLTIQPGESYGIYVALTSYNINTNRLAYTNGSNVYSDANLQLTAGVGKGFPTFTGSTFANRIWNGNVFYALQTGAPPVLEQVDGSGLTSGDFFPIGTTTQTWVATDNEGNTSSCTWDYTVLEYPNPISSIVCNDYLIVALDPDCQALIGADQILEGGPYGCYDDYTVEIFQGSTNIGNLLGSAQIGMTLEVVVTDPESGNFCEGQLFVEDNLPPSITCEDVTIFCTESSAVGDVPNPDASDSCGPVVLDYSEIAVEGVCGDDYLEIITRVWTASDPSGNTNSCSQNVTIARPTLDDVDFPQDYNDIELPSLDCTNPDTDPSNTGFPTIAGIEFMANDVCELQVSYEDLVLEICEGSYKILRNWTVTENCTDDLVEVEQIIVVMDKTEPVINCPSSFTVGTSTESCSADVALPFAFVSDDCSASGSISIAISATDGTVSGTTLNDLGLGSHEVTYTASDDCGNSSSCSFTVTVEDDVPPVAVCDEVTAVSLTNDGTAFVCTPTFDDGSYDNCGILAFKAKRQDAASFVQFTDCIEFGCDDVGETIVVRMRVYDQVGNSVFTENDPDARFNECLVEVVVSDKMKPEITCPSNKTLDCDEFESDVWDGITASGPGAPVYKLPENVQIGYFANAYDNCGVERVNVIQQGSVDQCGEGAYQRIYTAIDHQGLTTTCVQIITIANSTPFNITDTKCWSTPLGSQHSNSDGVEWPCDIELTSCGAGLTPDELATNPAVNANNVRPQITEDGCDLVGVSYKDTELPIASPGCVKLIRKWSVVDWCQPDASYALGYVTWEYSQIISVLESTPPVINSVCEDITVCGYEDNCEPIPVSLSLDASDDCTDAADLTYYYQIDAFYDINEPGSPTYDFNSNFNPFANAGNAGNVADGSYPIGTHLIFWRVEDGCGNVATCKYTFTVQDCKPPAPICKMLATAIVPADGTVTINVSSVENGDSYDNCTPYEDIIFSYEPDAVVTEMTFTCLDVGNPVNVTIYATDEYGNQNSCQSTISIIDPFGWCNLTPTATVSGVIETENEVPVALTNVSVTNTNGTNGSVVSTTSNDGAFSFDLPTGENYTITPEKNINWLNGVSTYDLVLMSQHILGLNPLNSPYKIIAADATNDGKVTTFDIVELRTLILHIVDELPNNKSWRFVDKSYQFPNPQNPFSPAFPEVININDLDQDMLYNDFVGVKIGDLNGDVVASNLVDPEERSYTGSLEIKLMDEQLTAGQTYEIPFYAKDFKGLFGYQFTLEFDSERLGFAGIEAGTLPALDEGNFGLRNVKDGYITTSWNAMDVSLEDDAILFTLRFEAKAASQLSEVLEVSSALTRAEAYTANGRSSVELVFADAPECGAVLTEDALRLFQNQPNPFRNSTTISFYLPEATDATLKVFDSAGKVLKVVEGSYSKGFQTLTLNRSDLGSAGMLYYQLDTENGSESKKMLLID